MQEILSLSIRLNSKAGLRQGFKPCGRKRRRGLMQQKWKIAVMLFAIAALNYGDRSAIAAVFPLLRSDLALSDVMLAGIGSVFLWSYAIGSPIAGYIADRLSRTKILLASVIAWSLIMALTGLVHQGTTLLIMRALLGIAECAYLPASIALIADHHDSKTRATAMGLQLAGMNIGLIAGSAIAGYLAERVGWRRDFFILGGAGLLLALIASFVLCDAPRIREEKESPVGWRGIGQLLHMPPYMAVVVGAMLISIGTWIFLNWLPLYFYDRFHLSLALAGLSGPLMLQLAAIIGAVAGGYLSDRLAAGDFLRRRILLLAMGYFCAAPFLLPFLWKSSLGITNLCIFLYALIKAIGSAGESPVLCELAGARLRSTALGILNMMNCIAGGLGILWAGLLKRHYGLGTAFGSLAATVAIAGAVVLCGYFSLERREAEYGESSLHTSQSH
jgi:predicted MFS family arabinose efflux permease